MTKLEVDRLCHLARSAAHYELSRVADRDALVLTLPEGKRTIFLDPGVRAALEAALKQSPPPPLTHPGLPVCTWDVRAHTAVGVFEETNIRVILTEAFPDEARGTLLDRVATAVARARDGRARIGEAIAAQLTAQFNDAWRSEGPPKTSREISQELTLETIRASFAEPDFATVYFATGPLFGGHLVEAWLDANGELESCQLAG